MRLGASLVLLVMVSRTESDVHTSIGTKKLISCSQDSGIGVGGLERAIQEVSGEGSILHGQAIIEQRAITTLVDIILGRLASRWLRLGSLCAVS